MRARSAKPKRNIFTDESCYSHYDPSEEGYGNASEWRSAFKYRMGFDAARERVGKKSPLYMIFGDTMPIGWTARTAQDQWNEIKAAWRKLARTCHPDFFFNDKAKEEQFKDLMGAFELLEDEYRRKGVRV